MSRYPVFDTEIAETTLANIESDAPEQLLQILRVLLEKFGYIDDAVIPMIAGKVNLSRAEVYSVVSFYHDFRRHPPGEKIVKVCQAESCQAMGSRTLTAHAKEKLGIDFHETTPDGRFTLEPVYCLGNCACSPAVMIDDAVYGRVDAGRFDALMDERQQDS